MGVIDGVVATKPGWIQKLEVVEVAFDPTRVTFEALLKHAEKCDCAAQVFTRTDAQQKLAAAAVGPRAQRTDEAVRIDDDKYYASRTALRALPMTPLQAARVNARVGRKQDPAPLLSPSQKALLAQIEARPKGWPSAIGVEFRKAWARAQEHAAKK